MDPDSASLSTAAAAVVGESSARDQPGVGEALHIGPVGADSLKMVFDPHPDVARGIVRGLEGHHPAPQHPGSPGLRRLPPLVHQEPEPSRDNAEPGQPTKATEQDTFRAPPVD